MFNAKSKSDSVIGTSTGNTLIGAGTTIKGDLISNGDVRIDGTLIGNISGTAKVLIGQEGVVQGDIEGQQADIQGNVTGKLHIRELLNLRGDAIIRGNIHAGKLQIEPSVTFNGQCHMGKEASVVEMASEELTHAIAK
jgi:cytoskeletal protein CcmA (bactofilin family)